jgi:hypothetical protein
LPERSDQSQAHRYVSHNATPCRLTTKFSGRPQAGPLQRLVRHRRAEATDFAHDRHASSPQGIA